MKLRISKGTKDYLPEEQIVRSQIKEKLKRVFERYGYSPLETPILEMQDILTSKYAGGSEILKEMFTLTDQGRRELGLRYDLTVPLARVIGMNPELRFPFKRYEMGRVFRDGPIKLGRLREFWQCDIDVVGSDNIYFDAELLALAADGINELGLNAVIEVNTRKILTGIMEDAGIPLKLSKSVILSLDKLKKIGEKGVEKELVEKGVGRNYFEKLFDFLRIKGNNSEILDALDSAFESKTGKEGVAELRTIFSYLNMLGVKAEVNFVPSLARGLEYYTGMIFEGFAKDSEMTSSICGGGRWDNMIGEFIGKGAVPATGFSFGLDAIYAAVRSTQQKKTVMDAWLVPIKAFDDCLVLLAEFREQGIRCDVDVKQRSISKNLDYANKEGIPFVVIVGEQELRQKKVKLKNMISGDEKLVSLKDAVKSIKSKIPL